MFRFIVSGSLPFKPVIVLMIILGFSIPEAIAQRGKGGGSRAGGARPSMARVGAGGARPSTSRPGMSRPAGTSRPAVQRPNMSRPSAGQFGTARPNVQRPNTARPSFGNAGARPGTGRPAVPTTRPSTLPSIGATRPSTRPSVGGARPGLGGAGGSPNMTRPATRPTLPGTGNRPGVNRPSLPSSNRPAVNNPRPPKPVTRPELGINRPGLDRPSFGNLNRPTTLPGNLDRPGIGGNRPGTGDRFPNRPNNRPVIGGNRPGFGNDTNINIGNNVNIGNKFGNQVGNQVGNRWNNRPNWDVDPGYSRPAWGIGAGGGWHNHWHNNCINNHHNWYNGCWHGYWGSSWYAPVAVGAVGWGLGTMVGSWGYNTSYYNPYYAQPAVAQAVPFDYSQPVVVNNYVSSDASGGEAQVVDATSEKGLAEFDSGLAKFKSGDYTGAVAELNSALRQLPTDPVVHEVRCLALFSTGDYASAAAGLNSFLSSAPGMDWTTMSSLYGNIDDYSAQLRNLEQFCQVNPNDAAAQFVLAYHYLVTGAKDDAVLALRAVVKNQPKDVTAKRMLDALAPVESAPAPVPSAPASTEETDLVGTWYASVGETSIELMVGEDAHFTWTAKTPGQKAVQLAGTISGSADGIALETSDQGTLAGTVTSKGKDAWLFSVSDAPPSDPGLSFSRKN